MSRNRIRVRRCRRSAASARVLATLALATAATAAAQAPRGAAEIDASLEAAQPDATPRARLVQDGPLSLEEAVRLVRRRFEGRVVSAETRDVNGRRVHVIRVLDDGRVRDIRVDAATGRIGR